MREADIRSVIERLSGDQLERFSFQLVRRKLYPGLNPTSDSYDLGEDARTEAPTINLHGNQRVSLFASRTAGWGKIEEDCTRCVETGRQIDVIVFATSGNPRTDVVTGWVERVKREYGWDLDVRTIKWLSSVAADPEFETLVLDHLGIPPPDDDFTHHIEREFIRHNEQALHLSNLNIPGLPEPLPRNEVIYVEDQLQLLNPVLLTGEPGTGKTGIGVMLTKSAAEVGHKILLLDARRVEHIRNEAELRQHFSLRGSLHSAIARLGKYYGCRLIIDQLDNLIGSPAANVLLDLAIECVGLQGVEVVVISRNREGHESQLLNRLTGCGFIELESRALDDSRVIDTLHHLGIESPAPDLIVLGRNLLNLELIGIIMQEQSRYDFPVIMDEVDLWEGYFRILLEREGRGSGSHNPEQIIADAVKLAKDGLNSDDRTFQLNYPLSYSQRRIESWGIIVRQEGRIYRFRHEKLQDFLYAWDATERGLMPQTLRQEISIHRTRNILQWMDKIYARRQSPLRTQFLREMFNVRY